MQQVKDLSVTQSVSSCFQEKKKSMAYTTIASDTRQVSRVPRPQRGGLTVAVMTVSAVSHTATGPGTPGAWEGSSLGDKA